MSVSGCIALFTFLLLSIACDGVEPFITPSLPMQPTSPAPPAIVGTSYVFSGPISTGGPPVVLIAEDDKPV